MRRVIPLISVCLLLTAAESAIAQQRLFALTMREVVELDPRHASLGTVIRRFPLDEASAPTSRDTVSLGGGELLAWTTLQGGGAVVLLHTRSGAVQRFTFPNFTPNKVIGGDGNARLVVLGYNASAQSVVLVADARSASVRFLNVGPLSPFIPQVTYAYGSDLLFAARRRGPAADSYHDVDVIQASTGALLKTLDLSPSFAGMLSTNATGTRLYNGLVGLDVASGTQFASYTSDRIMGNLALDEHRNRLLAHFVIGPGADPEIQRLQGIAAISADSLQLLGRVQLPKLPLPASTPRTAPAWTEAIDFSSQSATLFVLQAVEVGNKNRASTCHESQLIALDVDTGRVRQTVDTTAALGAGACHADLVRVTEPAPTSGPHADVTGHQVKLEWQGPFGATHYEIEAGSAPGLANLATTRVTEPQLVIDGVPPGVYFLRVRAVNTIGKSDASQEVQVIVP